MTPQPPPLAGCCIYWPTIRTTNKRFRTSWTLSGPTKQLSGPSGRSNITLKRLRKGLVYNFYVFLHCWHIFSSQIEREREREVYFFFQNGSIEYCYVFRPPNHDRFNLFNWRSFLIFWREDLPHFEYLTMCLKESLRDSSTVPLIQRLVQREMTIDGKVFPQNTLFTIAINSVHHNPAVWENPEEYRPERFSQENISNIDNFSYIPFSAGPR